ncbi:aprataxin [Strigomonas culicis]|uniref:Aprataxin n=1 Tax=Strigomonas culicis TaxID=28005 RepID=S9VXR9_9TRYP|nr:aprataxin [Strigomonas culicis]|eukprot:EPY31856.1 aprataxin [Strigomonas culicis]
MQAVADRYMDFLRRAEPSVYRRRRYLTGFHALPSLAPLHMHLLTMDLDSPCLKSKKHYNSFATFFFLTQPRVLSELQQRGYVGINQSVKELRQMEGQPMTCMWCGAPLKNMPAVKAHLPSCQQNQSLEP